MITEGYRIVDIDASPNCLHEFEFIHSADRAKVPTRMACFHAVEGGLLPLEIKEIR